MDGSTQDEDHDRTGQLADRLWQSLAAVTFDKDDAASIRTALAAAKAVLAREVWELREQPHVAAVCRGVWDELLETLLAYRFRAGLSASECAAHRAESLWFLPLYDAGGALPQH